MPISDRRIEKYKEAIRRHEDGTTHLAWFAENILKSADKTIRVKIEDIRKAFGSEFEKEDDTQIFDGMRSTLFFEHPFEQKEATIGVTLGRTLKGENILIMHYAHYAEFPVSLKG